MAKHRRNIFGASGGMFIGMIITGTALGLLLNNIIVGCMLGIAFALIATALKQKKE